MENIHHLYSIVCGLNNNIKENNSNLLVKMVQLKFVTLAACLWFQICLAMPLAEEDRYYEKEIPKDFAQWLTAALASSANINDPCRYHYNNIEYYHQFPKRNSELINSLLSVPKTMNDAGK